MGLSVNSKLFTNVELVTWGEKMKAAADDKDAQKPTIAAPGAYKKDTKWRVWKEQFLNYMGTKNGQNKAPLSYAMTMILLMRAMYQPIISNGWFT
jgi:hypothetical protein